MPAKGNVAGFTYAQFFKRLNSKAYMQVSNPSTVTGPTTSHALLIRDPIRASIPQVSRAIATFKGGSGVLGQMTLGVDSVGNFEAEIANLDAYLMAMANISNIDSTTVSGWSIFGPNNANPVLQNMGCVLHSRFQSRDSGSDGDPYWLNLFILNCEIEIDLSTVTREGGDNPSPSRVIIRPSMAEKFPNGQALSSNQGFKNNKTDYFYAITTNPIGMTLFVADGIATTFTLGYKPVSSSVASGNTNNWFTKNAANTAPSSVNLSTSVVTIAAGSASDLWHSFYLTDFDAVA